MTFLEVLIRLQNVKIPTGDWQNEVPESSVILSCRSADLRNNKWKAFISLGLFHESCEPFLHNRSQLRNHVLVTGDVEHDRE